MSWLYLSVFIVPIMSRYHATYKNLLIAYGGGVISGLLISVCTFLFH